MSLDEGLSRFIGRIYEAAHDPEAWNAVIAELMARTGSRVAFISYVDLSRQVYSKSAFHAPEESGVADGAREYWEEFQPHDPSLAWASAHPFAGVCDTARTMPREDFRDLAYIKWQQSRFGTLHWRVFYSQPVDGFSSALSLHPPAEAGPASNEQGRLHRLLFEHMERSVRLAARPPDLSAASEACFVLDTDGRVLSMSPRAEELLRSRDGLTIESRVLSACLPETTARLNASIASALNHDRGGAISGGVRLQRRSGGADWLALVSPCPHALDHLPVATPAAILRVVETGPKARLSPAHAELFDLSPREFDLARALLEGHSLESLCSLLGISRNTAKVHLQSLFRKTGTNRQSELVHLLAQVERS